MLGTWCSLVNTQNPVPSWSSLHTIMQPLKLTLLTKSRQSMCKYRLCNLDLQRSLHIEKGAVSCSKQACPLKGLSIFQNILSSLCNGQLYPFLWHSKGLKCLIKSKPVLPLLLFHMSGFQTFCFQQELLFSPLDASENMGNKFIQAETTHPSS